MQIQAGIIGYRQLNVCPVEPDIRNKKYRPTSQLRVRLLSKNMDLALALFLFEQSKRGEQNERR
jgi:hypothetical protein